ncbi:hypothetical protein RHMOL_Rhmol06G0233300 [Rhododendron molle]|uniref:Uncharacterized protein n=1 Tax=Rhododendron molle TaxID=49168 RepID=A0ACC0NHT3_RHOML|nr:hypothetical protein RHMOL_Rhmol06G0233300 [Rhododendron molle]
MFWWLGFAPEATILHSSVHSMLSLFFLICLRFLHSTFNPLGRCRSDKFGV